MLGHIAVILVVLVPALAEAGDLTPTAQARAVAWSSMGEFGQYICGPPPDGCTPLSVTPTSGGNGLVAGDFLPFSATLDGIVDQLSTIDPKQLTAVGSHAATASASLSPTGTPGIFDIATSEIESQSSYSVDFDLTQPTPYHLAGEIGATSLLAASLARIRLTGPGGATLAEIELSGDGSCLDPSCEDLGSDTLAQSGTLAPGSYTLLAEVDGHAFSLISPGTGIAAGGTHTGSYDLTLTLDPVNVPSLGAFGPWLALLLGGLGAVMAHRSARHAR